MQVVRQNETNGGGGAGRMIPHSTPKTTPVFPRNTAWNYPDSFTLFLTLNAVHYAAISHTGESNPALGN